METKENTLSDLENTQRDELVAGILGWTKVGHYLWKRPDQEVYVELPDFTKRSGVGLIIKWLERGGTEIFKNFGSVLRQSFIECAEGEKKMFCREVKFTCPTCKSHKIEEIQVGLTTSTEVLQLGTEECVSGILYGEQTNEGGHIDRYQCGECGFIINCEDGLDEDGLVKAIDKLNEEAS